MKFCKKCHKIIITKVYTKKVWMRSCYCDKTHDIESDSELGGVLVKQLSKGKRLKEFR